MPPVPASTQLDAAVIREAARWLVRLHSGEAGPGDYEAFERWRRARDQHELAWQRAERLSRKFGAVSPALGVPVLTRRDPANRRAVLKAVAVLGAGVPLAWLGYRHLPQGGGDGYRTAVGERRELVLADGSQVQMNTATDMAVRYSDQARLVLLRRGEIYVRTAADAHAAARPFLVRTPQGRLRALGTRFTVRRLDGGQDATLLIVLEHSVEAALPDGSRRIVQAGQALRFTSTGFGPARPAPPTAATPAGPAPGWTRGMLQAEGMRLDAFLEELSRYRPGLIVCDPRVAGLRVSGVFRLEDPEHILGIVARTLPVRLVRRTRYWVTVTARAA
ncbi:FecR domain-containing protein [Orrella sp. JC864]|uniref:FecR domain-containing protein n=1 Tax=Orrella sp. JC864 TaxID=3120298 RepID=UPI00300B80C1